MKLVLDTHAALWLVQGNARLSPTARSRIEAAQAEDLLISDLMLLELSMLVHKERITIAGEIEPFIDSFSRRFRLCPIDASIAARAMSLGLPHGDPFDRVFVATAIERDAALVTKDRAITDAAVVPVVW